MVALMDAPVMSSSDERNMQWEPVKDHCFIGSYEGEFEFQILN